MSSIDKTQYTVYKGIDYSPQTLFFKYLSLQADGINPWYFKSGILIFEWYIRGTSTTLGCKDLSLERTVASFQFLRLNILEIKQWY